MTEKIHWFRAQEDCEKFFTKLAENCGEKLTPAFVFEGNSQKTYQWIIDVANIIGYESIGVLERDYKDIFEDSDYYDHQDEIFIKPSYHFKQDNNRVWIEADEVSLESDGSIRIWWD